MKDEFGRIIRKRVCGTCGKGFKSTSVSPLKRTFKKEKNQKRTYYYCCYECMLKSYRWKCFAESIDLEARAKAEERRYMKQKQKDQARKEREMEGKGAEEKVEKRVKEEKHKPKHRPIIGMTNICFDCQRACGECSWSRSFEPVPGWTAEEVPYGGDKTFHITACPQFVEDERKSGSSGTIADEAFQALLEMWGIR